MSATALAIYVYMWHKCVDTVDSALHITAYI